MVFDLTTYSELEKWCSLIVSVSIYLTLILFGVNLDAAQFLNSGKSCDQITLADRVHYLAVPREVTETDGIWILVILSLFFTAYYFVLMRFWNWHNNAQGYLISAIFTTTLYVGSVVCTALMHPYLKALNGPASGGHTPSASDITDGSMNEDPLYGNEWNAFTAFFAVGGFYLLIWPLVELFVRQTFNVAHRTHTAQGIFKVVTGAYHRRWLAISMLLLFLGGGFVASAADTSQIVQAGDDTGVGLTCADYPSALFYAQEIDPSSSNHEPFNVHGGWFIGQLVVALVAILVILVDRYFIQHPKLKTREAGDDTEITGDSAVGHGIVYGVTLLIFVALEFVWLAVIFVNFFGKLTMLDTGKTCHELGWGELSDSSSFFIRCDPIAGSTSFTTDFFLTIILLMVTMSLLTKDSQAGYHDTTARYKDLERPKVNEHTKMQAMKRVAGDRSHIETMATTREMRW